MKKTYNYYVNYFKTISLLYLVIFLNMYQCNLTTSTNTFLTNSSKISVNNGYINDTKYNNDNYINVIVNGNFESPKIKGNKRDVNRLNNWVTHNSKVTLMVGNKYNKNWNSGQVLDLNRSDASEIKQNFNLKQKTECIVQFDYASIKGKGYTILIVYLNDKQIFFGHANDKNMHKYSEKFVCEKGVNNLKFVTQKIKKAHGMTIDNVKVLIPKELEDPQQEIIQDDVQDESNIEDDKNIVYKNIIKNGDFEKPKISKKNDIIEDIPNWYVKPNAEIGLGNKYHKNWTSGQVIDLHAKTNTSIQQEFILNEETKCTLKFDYLAPKGKKSSAIIVELNNEVILFSTVDNTNINKFEKQLLCKEGINSLVFKGQGNSRRKGMTVDNIELLVPEEVEVAQFENNIAKNGDNKDINYAKNLLESMDEIIDSQTSISVKVFNLEEKSYCKVRFQYAVEGRVKKTSMKVFLNNQVIYSGSPMSKKVHYFDKIFVCKEGQNTLTFKGTSTKKKGVAIDNVEVLVDTSSNNFPIINERIFVEYADAIINGGFDIPNLNGKNKKLSELYGWRVNPEAEVGFGEKFNKNWKSGQVVDLDTNQNTAINQEFVLSEETDCKIKFDYLARTGNDKSSMIVVLNNEIIYTGSSNDKNIHSYENSKKCKEGINYLEFKSDSTSKGKGMTIDNVKLLVPEYVKIFDFERNAIVNGEFENPNLDKKKKILTRVPGWIVSPNVELGIGKKYNRGMNYGQVANLYSNMNSSISQVFNLEEESYCKVRFQYAVEGSVKKTSMKVFLNNQVIYSGSPMSKKVHYFDKIFVCKEGENTLTFKGTSTKKNGVAIDNVEVLVESISIDNKDNEESSENNDNNDIIDNDTNDIDIDIDEYEYEEDSSEEEDLYPDSEEEDNSESVIVPGYIVDDGIDFSKPLDNIPIFVESYKGANFFFNSDQTYKCKLEFSYIPFVNNKNTILDININDSVYFSTDYYTGDNNLYSKEFDCLEGKNNINFNRKARAKSVINELKNVKLLRTQTNSSIIPNQTNTIPFDKVNFILNGSFEFPRVKDKNMATNSILGWDLTSDIKLSKGNFYSNEWSKSQQVVELISNSELSLSQTFDLKNASLCIIKFDYFFTSGQENLPIIVTFNDKVIFDEYEINSNVNLFAKLAMCRKGPNTLKFKIIDNTSSNGIVLDNVWVSEYEQEKTLKCLQ